MNKNIKTHQLDNIEYLLKSLTAMDASKDIYYQCGNVAGALSKLNVEELKAVKQVLTYIDDKYNNSEPFNKEDLKEGIIIAFRPGLNQIMFIGKIVEIMDTFGDITYKVNAEGAMHIIRIDNILKVLPAE